MNRGIISLKRSPRSKYGTQLELSRAHMSTIAHIALVIESSYTYVGITELQ